MTRDPEPNLAANLARRRGVGFALLALLAYVPALLSDVGRVSADTKSYLYLDPDRLVGRAASMWDPNVGLGTVTHQTIGYLFPMGPYYSVFERLGAPDWLAQRIWLGTLVFCAALGMLAFARQLGRQGPGVVVAALAYAFSPYALHYSARLSVLLMPWAALGFLMALIIRCVREGGWRAPLIFALVVQIVGGVNATALVFAGVAPILWIAWSWLGAREVSAGRAFGTVARVGSATVVMSLWWIAGLSIQGGYGINVLRYSETVAVVARTSAPNEVLRGLGYWFFYGRDRLGPWVEGSTPYTQNLALIVLSYSIVAAAVGAAAFVRWRHRGFFAWLLLVGTVIAVGAHPYDDPHPLGEVFKAFATSSTAGLALRSTPRAVPLVTMSVAMFLGAGVDAVVSWWRTHDRPRLAVATPLVVGALVLGSFPALWTGGYYGDNLLRDEDVPGYWREVAAAIDSGRDTRVLEIPGSDFAAYRWGVTVDPITPGLIERPYVARELIPYGSAPSADLLNALDRRLQESAAEPAGFVEVLRRLGVGAVVVRNDLEWERYNLVRPRELAAFLDQVEGLGPRSDFGPTLDASAEYPSFGIVAGIDERSLLGPDGPMPSAVAVMSVEESLPIVRVYPVAGSVVLSGDGEGLVDAAEVGVLARDRAVLYSAGLDPAALDSALASVDRLVVTDSNRRRARRWSTVRDNLGETESTGFEPIEDDLTDARLPVFPEAGDDAATVVEYLPTDGPVVTRIAATGTGDPIAYTPENRPARAFDGDPNTSWKTSAFDRAVGDRIEVTLEQPITTGSVTLVQVRNGPVDRFVTRARLRFDGGDVLDVDLDERSRTLDGQVIDFERREFSRFTVEVRATNLADGPLYSGQSEVGFAEIVLADKSGRPVRVREVVRVPRDLTDAARAFTERTGTVVPASYVFTRLRITPVPPRYDEELSLDRRFDVVATDRDRVSFDLSGTARFDPNPYDRGELESALGITYTDGFTGTAASAVMRGCVTCGPASAFDTDPTTAWRPPIGDVAGSWIEARANTDLTLTALDLTVLADGRHSLPTRLAITVAGERVEVDVPRIGESDVENSVTTVRVPLPTRLVGPNVRIEILEIDPRLGSSYYDSAPRDLPVGIAATGIVATDWDPERVDLGACRDDLIAIDGEPLPIRIAGTPAAAGKARAGMAISTCTGTPVQLGAGTHTLTTARGVDTAIDIDRLVLSAPSPTSARAPAVSDSATSVRVIDDDRTSMRVEVETGGVETWLVLGQSHNAGWTARLADGTDLGSPTLIDGYANGWRIDGSDSPVVVELEWTPQRRVRWALIVSIGTAGLALGILVWSRFRRGRPQSADACAPELSGWSGRGEAVTTGVAIVGVVAIGVAALLVVEPWAAAVVTALAALAMLGRRRPLAIAGPLLALLIGLFVAVQQYRWSYPPIFEWPTLFPRVRPLGWMVAMLPTVVWFVDRLRGEDEGAASRVPSRHRPSQHPES